MKKIRQIYVKENKKTVAVKRNGFEASSGFEPL